MWYNVKKQKGERKMRFSQKDYKKFEIPAEELAPWLLGKILCRRITDGKILRFRILETEAYGDNDSATHANKYRTGNAAVTQRMIGGTIYVHYKNNNYSGSSFDIVAGDIGQAESVLVRSAVNLDTGEKYSKIRLLGEALYIDYDILNRTYLLSSNEIWLEDDGFITEGRIKKETRIGLDAADIQKEDKQALKRYILEL